MKLLPVFSAVALLCASHASAATFSSSLNYSGSDNFLPGGGFNRSTTLNMGIAVLDFGARASTGAVTGSASATLSGSFADSLSLAEAQTAALTLSTSNIRSSFDTFIGATAGTGLDFGSLAGINPPRISLGEIGYSLVTEGARSGFGTSSDQAVEAISGFGIPTFPGISLQAEVTLDGSQKSSFTVSNLFGTVRATHESGAVVTDAFSLTGSTNLSLDLSRAGAWTLELLGVGMSNSFDTSLGLTASARVGAAVGFGCGDFSDDDDNGLFCAGDVGAVATSPQLTLIDPPADDLNFGRRSLNIGSLMVIAPVPLPAGMPLLLAGLGVFYTLRRRA